MYGAETWTLKAEHVSHLNSYQRWVQRVTPVTLESRFGMEWSIPDLIMSRRLEWLGHL